MNSNFDLQENFVKQLASEIQGSWDKIEINYEYFPWKNGDVELYKAKRFLSDSFTQFSPSIEAFDILDELRNIMKTDDTWTSCLIDISSDGKYDFQFGYGMPPMVTEHLKMAGEIQ